MLVQVRVHLSTVQNISNFTNIQMKIKNVCCSINLLINGFKKVSKNDNSWWKVSKCHQSHSANQFFSLQKAKNKKTNQQVVTLESHWSINWSRMKREGGPWWKSDWQTKKYLTKKHDLHVDGLAPWQQHKQAAILTKNRDKNEGKEDVCSKLGSGGLLQRQRNSFYCLP